MVNVCPLCTLRISNWMMAAGKSLVVGEDIYHKSCLIDYQLKHGHPHPAIGTEGAILHALMDNYRK